jgi:hypothetical protein
MHSVQENLSLATDSGGSVQENLSLATDSGCSVQGNLHFGTDSGCIVQANLNLGTDVFAEILLIYYRISGIFICCVCMCFMK